MPKRKAATASRRGRPAKSPKSPKNEVSPTAKRSRRAITIAQQKNQRHDEMMRLQQHAEVREQEAEEKVRNLKPRTYRSMVSPVPIVQSPPPPSQMQMKVVQQQQTAQEAAAELVAEGSDQPEEGLSSVALSSAAAYLDEDEADDSEQTQFIEIQQPEDTLNTTNSTDEQQDDTGPPALSPAHEPEQHIQVDDDDVYDPDADVSIDVEEPNVVYHLVPTSFMDVMPGQLVSNPSYTKLHSKLHDDPNVESYDSALFDVVDQYLVSPPSTSAAADAAAAAAVPPRSAAAPVLAASAFRSRAHMSSRALVANSGITVTASSRPRTSRIVVRLDDDSQQQQQHMAGGGGQAQLDYNPQPMRHQQHNENSYICRAYSPKQHIGGRGHFGVSADCVPPIPAVIERADDYVALPPTVANDHSYGKVPPPDGHIVYQTYKLPPAHLLPTAQCHQGVRRIVLTENVDGTHSAVTTSAYATKQTEAPPRYFIRKPDVVVKPPTSHIRVHLSPSTLSSTLPPSATATRSVNVLQRIKPAVRRINLVRSSFDHTNTTSVYGGAAPVHNQQQQPSTSAAYSLSPARYSNANNRSRMPIVAVKLPAPPLVGHPGSRPTHIHTRRADTASQDRQSPIDVLTHNDDDEDDEIVDKNVVDDNDTNNNNILSSNAHARGPGQRSASGRGPSARPDVSSSAGQTTQHMINAQATQPITVKASNDSTATVLSSAAAASPRLSTCLTSPNANSGATAGGSGAANTSNNNNMIDDDSGYEHFRMAEHSSVRAVPVLVDQQLPANILDDDE